MDLQALQHKLLDKIARYGSTIVLRLVTRSEAFDPATGRMVEENHDRPVHGLRTRPESREFAGVEAGDMLVLVSAVELTTEGQMLAPDTGSCVLMGNEEWPVVEVYTVQPGDVPVLYKLLLRRA